MKIIETTKEMRNLYVKHLNKLDDYANGDFKDDNCYMCEAANAHPEAKPLRERDSLGDCDFCPLEEYQCNTYQREINLVCISDHLPVWNYTGATPESIRRHIKWMEKQIKEKTDCEIYHEVER